VSQGTSRRERQTFLPPFGRIEEQPTGDRNVPQSKQSHSIGLNPSLLSYFLPFNAAFLLFAFFLLFFFLSFHAFLSILQPSLPSSLLAISLSANQMHSSNQHAVIKSAKFKRVHDLLNKIQASNGGADDDKRQPKIRKLRGDWGTALCCAK
jgi:hypothetical protein